MSSSIGPNVGGGDYSVGGPPDLGNITGAPPTDTPPASGFQDVVVTADGKVTDGLGGSSAKRTGNPGDPILPPLDETPGADVVDATGTTVSLSCSEWLNVAYKVLNIFNMQECMKNENEAELTEAKASLKNSIASFQTSLIEADLIKEKSAAEAEKLITSAVVSLVTSVGMSVAGLCTTVYGSRLQAKAESAKDSYDNYKKANPDDPDPFGTQATAGNAPLSQSQQAARDEHIDPETGEPKYIEMQRKATNANAVANTITNNLGRTIPDVISNIVQATFTVQIGALEAGIAVTKAMETQMDRQTQNANAAAGQIRDILSGMAQFLTGYVDAGSRNFSIGRG